jgi:hypothetical protein
MEDNRDGPPVFGGSLHPLPLNTSASKDREETGNKPPASYNPCSFAALAFAD